MHARKRAYTCGWGIEICKKCNPLRVLASPAGWGLPRLRRLTETGSGRARDGLAPGPLARTRTLSQGSDFVAGAAFWQGRVQISWQVHHFRKVADFVTGAAFSYFWHGRIANPIGTDAQGGACIFRGRRSIFARSGTDLVALSQGQVQNSWQVHHFRKVKCKIRGRRITFARSSTDFVAGAALSRGQVQISWQAQHFCKVNFRSRGSKIATFKCESSKRSQLSQLGLENLNF